MKRLKMLGSSLSQLFNVATAKDLSNTGPNESVSARMHRQGHKKREAFINGFFRLFGKEDHCQKSYMSDVTDAYALIIEFERGRNDL